MFSVFQIALILSHKRSPSHSKMLFGNSVLDGICVLRKFHMRSTLSIDISSFPIVAFETVPMLIRLPMSLSRPFKEDSQALPPCLSLLQAISGVISLALCLQLVSQAPQHFRSSEKQATCEGRFARQSVCSVIFLHSGMSRAVHPQEFSKADVSPVWANSHSTFHFL